MRDVTAVVFVLAFFSLAYLFISACEHVVGKSDPVESRSGSDISDEVAA